MTLEGTIIHKSGLITGGRSTHGGGKKWDEKDVQGTYLILFAIQNNAGCHVGLRRARDALTGQLRDLVKQKSHGKTDDNLIAEVARSESTIVVAKDDLVRPAEYHDVPLIIVARVPVNSA